MVQVGCVDVGVSDVKGRPIRLRQSEVCLGQGDGSVPTALGNRFGGVVVDEIDEHQVGIAAVQLAEQV